MTVNEIQHRDITGPDHVAAESADPVPAGVVDERRTTAPTDTGHGPDAGAGNRRRPSSPLVWMLATHAGAADDAALVSHTLAFAGDPAGMWPEHLDLGGAPVSPFVVLVTRESFTGIAATHELLRAYHDRAAGPHAHVLGLLTVAAQPGRVPTPLARQLRVLDALVPADLSATVKPGTTESDRPRARWRLGWHADWLLAPITDLPVWDSRDDTMTDPTSGSVWTPGDKAMRRDAAAIRNLGLAITTAVRHRHRPIPH